MEVFGIWVEGVACGGYERSAKASASPSSPAPATSTSGICPPHTPRSLLHRNVQRFRGGLAFKAHRRCASLNSGLESNKEEGARQVLTAESGFLWYLSISFRKSTPPQNRQLDILFSKNRQRVDDFVG